MDQYLNLARETGKRQKKKKIIHDDILSANFDAIVILWIYTQFGPMLKLDFGRMVCKTNVFININFLSYKNCKQNSNISNTVLILLLRVKVIFSPKNANFLQKNADINRNKWVLILKGKISKIKHVCALTYQISCF